MKNITRLTESELNRIINRVINETIETENSVNGINLDGVNISVTTDSKGNLFFKYGSKMNQFKVSIDTPFWDGSVSISKIYREGSDIKIQTKSGKTFPISSTDIMSLIKQFKSDKSTLSASAMGATVNLSKIA